jgi:ribosomal protein S24E
LEGLELTPIAVAGISSVFGLISGGIASLIAPWANWRIEKRRQKQLQRRKIIDEARHDLSGTPYRREVIRKLHAYSAIRTHLSEELVGNIEAHNRGGGEEAIQTNIMRELSDLEKKWKLV